MAKNNDSENKNSSSKQRTDSAKVDYKDSAPIPTFETAPSKGTDKKK